MREAGFLPTEPAPGNQNQGESAARPQSRALLVFGVLSLTFLAYSGTLTFDFVYDDRALILENAAVQSWGNVPRYFTEHYWGTVYPEMAGNYYRPLCLLWVRTNYALFGEHAWAWHLTTVLLHLATTFLVFRLSLRLLGDDSAAATAALIFGVHPVHIEAVAWISGLTEPLFAVPLLLALLCHLRWREESEAKWLALAIFFQALAMLAKETALIFPLLVGAWEWGSRERSSSGSFWTAGFKAVLVALRRSFPYWVLVPFYLLVRTLVLGAFRHLPTDLPFAAVFYTWPSLAWFWVRQLVWPFNLSGFYDLTTVRTPSWMNFVLPGISLAALLALMAWAAKRSPRVAMGVAFLTLPLLPLLDIRVFAEDDFAHDRFLYLPSIGLALLTGLAAKRFPEGRDRLLRSPASRLLPTALLGGVLTLSTASQIVLFADDITFFQYSAERAPENKFATTNLASRLAEKGRYEEALQHLERVRRTHPGYWVAAYNLAYTYYRLGRLADAEAQFLRAIQISPHDPDQYMYLGLTYFKEDRLEEAERAIRHALALDDDKYGYHFALGVVLHVKGDRDGARAEFQRELALHPDNLEAAAQLSNLREPADDSHGLRNSDE